MVSPFLGFGCEVHRRCLGGTGASRPPSASILRRVEGLGRRHGTRNRRVGRGRPGTRRGRAERRVDIDALAGERMREGESRGVQELTPERADPARRRRDRRRPAGRSRARWTRIWWVRPVSSVTESSAFPPMRSTSSKWVIASRGVSVSSENRVGSSRSRPIGASIRPVRDAGTAADERECTCARARVAGRGRRGARAPPRSARRPSGPTCRGRAGERSRAARAPRRRRCRRAASTSVPLARPAPGWTTRPAGLSTTARCSSCQAILGSGPVGSDSGAGSVGCGKLDALAALEAVALRRAAARRRAPRRRPPARRPPASRGGRRGSVEPAPLRPRRERPTPFGGFRSTVTVSRHSRGRRRIASPSRAEGPRPRPCWVGARG